jgi:hypothetical protein
MDYSPLSWKRPASGKVIGCPHCSKKFAAKYKLKLHLMLEHKQQVSCRSEYYSRIEFLFAFYGSQCELALDSDISF